MQSVFPRLLDVKVYSKASPQTKHKRCVGIRLALSLLPPWLCYLITAFFSIRPRRWCGRDGVCSPYRRPPACSRVQRESSWLQACVNKCTALICLSFPSLLSLFFALACSPMLGWKNTTLRNKTGSSNRLGYVPCHNVTLWLEYIWG
jgi:hypothetical protein